MEGLLSLKFILSAVSVIALEMPDGAVHRCDHSSGPCSFRAEVLILFPGSGSASDGRHRENWSEFLVLE